MGRQWDWSPPQWDTRGMSRISLGFQELWDGIVRLEPSRVGQLGHVQDVPGLPETLGWDGQWEWSCLEWDSRDMSRISLGFPQL